MTPYTLIRTDRKTVCIQMTAAGQVVVRAPRRLGRGWIDQFVADHQDWILRRQRELQTQNAQTAAFSLTEGMEMRLCGETYAVHIVPGLKLRVLRGQLIVPTGEMSALRGPILALARKTAAPWLRHRLEGWAGRMGVDFSEVRLSSARCRWGSCSRDGVIRISVFLLFAPERAIDYVLVHELAHRRHFDHSPAFWATVEAAMPDYRQQRALLREYQREPLVQSLAQKERNAD